MRELTFSMAGVNGVLRSDAVDFMTYAERHLMPLRLRQLAGACAIEASLSWHDGPPPADRHVAAGAWQDTQRLDRDLYVESGHISWFRIDDCRDLHLRAGWNGSQLRVHGDYYFHLSRHRLRDRAKRLLENVSGGERRHKRFTTVLYYLVYYPVFWWLETVHGFHPIHAAGAVTRNGAVVLAGPSGVGKSSLVVALAAAGAELLSETFLLHHGTLLRPVREPILLDGQSRTWLGDAMRGLEPLRHEYGFARSGYHCLERLAEEGEAVAIVLPHRAAKTCLRPISPDVAHQRVSASNQIVKDVRRYWAFAAAFEALAPRGLMEQRERELERLTTGASCFEFGLGPELTRDEAVRLLCGVVEPSIARRPLRVHR